jgi:hypothetical protein
MDKERLYERIRSGLGAEVKFAKWADITEVSESVESASSFIYERSGFKIESAVKQRLIEEEMRFLSGESIGVSINAIGPAFTAIGLERVAALSDDQLNYAADSLCGFKATDLPRQLGRDHIKPRAGIAVGPSPERFIAKVKGLRDSNLSQVELFKINALINKELNTRLDAYSNTLPNKFVQKKNGKEYLSPARVFLLAYSIASDDFLSPSTSILKVQMRGLHNVNTRIAGYYPSPEGHFAYGSNGYLYSSPIDLVLDANTVNRLFDSLLSRGGKH